MSHPPRHIIIAIVVILGIIGIGYYFQISIIINNWWILIFLLCPLMHFFMGHGKHEKDGSDHDHSNNESHEKESEKKQGKSCH